MLYTFGNEDPYFALVERLNNEFNRGRRLLTDESGEGRQESMGDDVTYCDNQAILGIMSTSMYKILDNH